MGSYGIGVSRLVAAIAEQHHDDAGPGLAGAVAPCDVHLVVAGQGPRARGGAEPRPPTWPPPACGCSSTTGRVSAGVKFTDAELIGVPTIVVVGRRLADGVIEVKDRRTGERTETALDTAVEQLAALVRCEPVVARCGHLRGLPAQLRRRQRGRGR